MFAEQVSFETGFEGGVGVDRSKMRREAVQNGGASMAENHDRREQSWHEVGRED